MSLINDALKHVKQSQPQQTTSPAAQLPPVETAPRGVWLLPFAVVLFVTVACLLIAFAFFPRQKSAVQITPPSQKVQIALAVPVAQKAPPPPPPAQLATAAAPKPAPKPAPPALPVLKVQGIFYNNATWQAIVNGQSVFVGDSVDGFRVKLISRNHVRLIAPDGTEKALALGD